MTVSKSSVSVEAETGLGFYEPVTAFSGGIRHKIEELDDTHAFGC